MKDRKVVKWLQLGGSRVVSGFASPPQTSKSGMVLGESERFASYDSRQETVRVVDALSGHEVASFRVDDPESESEVDVPSSVKQLAISPDGSMVALSGENGELQVLLIDSVAGKATPYEYTGNEQEHAYIDTDGDSIASS